MADTELIRPDEEFQYTAEADPVNASLIELSRIGAYVRTTANSTNTPGSATFVNDLTTHATNNSFSFSGVVSEVIVFDRKLSSEEREVVYSYLSKKYRLENRLPDAFPAADPSAATVNQSYWSIENHPNTKQRKEIPVGSEFTGVSLSGMLRLPTTIYKSAGTVTYDGTVLAGDTYDTIP